MARPKRDIDHMEFDLEHDSAASTAKLPVDVTSNVSPLKNFLEIPVDRLIEFQNKKESDFKSWPQEKFEMLMQSIQQYGIIDPISVRPTEKENIFEIMAGEHRWKAAKALGLRVVPVRVFDKCDTEKADAIFSITNVLRRDNSLKDRVNGWWHYTRTIRYKGEAGIQELVEEGAISYAVKAEADKGMRNVYRYAKLHDLIDELLDFADQKHLSVEAAEQLAYLTPTQQQDLLVYKHNLNNVGKTTRLHQLADGKIPDKTWSDETIKEIIFPTTTVKAISLREVASKIKTIVSEKMVKAGYGEVETIVANAIDAYLEAHPEFKK